MNPTYFASPAEFRKWLKINHKKETSLLVGFYKKKSGQQTMTWSESVDEALCYGWIDGVTKSIDENRYCIRFTPRKPNSIWSQVNIKKVAVLKKQNKMTTAGMAIFNNRRKDKTKLYSHESEQKELDTMMVQLFKQFPGAWKYFREQAPSYQKVSLHWIMTAKQEKTRLARLHKLIEACKKKRRLE